MHSVTGKTQKPIVSINLTPLVDVSLVLVVIFMATAPMLLRNGITIYPGEKPGQEEAAAADDSLIVRVSSQGIEINEKPVARMQESLTLLQGINHSRTKRVVVIPMGEVKHGEVIRVMDLAKQAGAVKIVIYNPAWAGH